MGCERESGVSIILSFYSSLCHRRVYWSLDCLVNCFEAMLRKLFHRQETEEKEATPATFSIFQVFFLPFVIPHTFRFSSFAVCLQCNLSLLSGSSFETKKTALQQNWTLCSDTKPSFPPPAQFEAERRQFQRQSLELSSQKFWSGFTRSFQGWQVLWSKNRSREEKSVDSDNNLSLPWFSQLSPVNSLPSSLETTFCFCYKKSVRTVRGETVTFEWHYMLFFKRAFISLILSSLNDRISGNLFANCC